MRMPCRVLIASAVVASAVAASNAWCANAVGDPEIKTDHTYYQGELAYSTLSRLVASALGTPGRPTTGETNKDQVLKLWFWRLEHYYHLMSPQEYNLPGVVPNPPNDNPLMTDYDCLSQQFSFGHGVCGTNHAMLRPIFEQAGFHSRRRGIVGDTTHEVFCNGRWVMVNTDSASIISMSNSTSAEFAGVDDIIGNVNLLLPNPLGIPQYPFGSQQSGAQGSHSQDWYGYYNGGFNLSTSAATHMYGEGYQARPIAYVLKKGETFTRFADRDGLPAYLGEAAGTYRWWGYVGAGGPFRDWSYVGKAPALQSPPTSNALGNSRYGNGIFEWTPTLSAGDLADGVVAKDANITYSGASPHLGTSGGTGTITLSFFSPYCIAGKPSDGTDPATAGSTGGAWIVPAAVGSVQMEISTNNGASWTTAGTLTGTTKLDFTDLVKGRHAYLMRFTVSNTAGLDAFTLNTCVEVATAVFPMLKASNSTVTYNAGGTGVIEQNPDFSSLAAANTFKVADSGNLTFNPLTGSNTWAYQASPNPASLTYRVTAPPGTTLKKVNAAADCGLHVPTPAGAYTKFEVSTDGTNFTQFGSNSPDSDDELSHSWAYASADVSAANVNQALVRITTYNGGYTAGFRYVRLYGEYNMGTPGALAITHTWNDSGGTGKTFTQNVPAGTTAMSYTVPTLLNPISKSVSFAVAASPAVPVLTTIVVSPPSATVTAGGTQTYTATGKDQFGNPLVSQPAFAWTVSGGGTIGSTGQFTAGTTAGGPFTVSAASGGKSGTATVIVTAAQPPTIGSPPTVPGTVTVGIPVTISTGATDPSGGTMTYQWNFGDGGTGSGSTVTYTYLAPGTFTLTLTVVSSTGVTTTLTIPVVVSPANSGGSGGAATLVPMTFSKILGSMNFTAQGKDSVSFSGTIPNLPAGLNPAGVPLILKIGTAALQFTLDKKGRAKNAQGSIQLTLKQGKRDPKTKASTFVGGNAAVKGKLQHGTWAQAWGFAPLAPAPATLALEIDVNGTNYGSTVTITAKMSGKSGKFKH